MVKIWPKHVAHTELKTNPSCLTLAYYTLFMCTPLPFFPRMEVTRLKTPYTSIRIRIILCKAALKTNSFV